MESRKRALECESSPENLNENDDWANQTKEKTEITKNEETTVDIDKKRKVNDVESVDKGSSLSKIDTTNTFDTLTKPTTSVSGGGGFGFQSYSNINPFDAVKYNNFQSKPLSVAVSLSETTTPRSTINPFSTPSPQQNPFMSFIDTSNNISSVNSNPWAVVSGSTPTSFSNFSSFASTNHASAVLSSTSGKISENKLTTEATVNVAKDTSIKSKSTSGDSIQRQSNDNDEDEVYDNDNEDGNEPDDDVEVNTDKGVYGKIYQLPENVPVITGEENEECLLLVRAKLYKLQTRTTVNEKESLTVESTQQSSETSSNKAAAADWVEVGVGPVKILRSRKNVINNSDSKTCPSSEDIVYNDSKIVNAHSKNIDSHRLVMRRESSRGGAGTKLLLNTYLKSYVSVLKVGDKMFRMTCLSLKDENSKEYVPCTYLFKLKGSDDTETLLNIIKNSIECVSVSGNKAASNNNNNST